jgi:hypothetical protein
MSECAFVLVNNKPQTLAGCGFVVNLKSLQIKSTMANLHEIWEPVLGFEKYFEVSNYGHVRRLLRLCIIHKKNGSTVIRPYKERALAQSVEKNGYLMFSGTVNGVVFRERVHRIVAKAFIPNPENKPAVNHKDGNKQNNVVSNLEWVTNAENSAHAFSIGLLKPKPNSMPGNKNPKAKAIVQMDMEGNIVAHYSYAKEAAIKTQTDYGEIRKCATGRKKSLKGYRWKYVE